MKSNPKNLLILATFTLAFSSPSVFSASLTWDTVSGDGVTITAGSGTWDTSTTAWNDAGTDVPWSQDATDDGSNTATFAGADAAVDTYEVSLGEDIAAESLTFDSSGYKITGDTLALIVTPTVGPDLGVNGSITVAAGKTATINSTLRYANNRAATITSNAGSILNLGGSTTPGANPQLNLSGAGTINISGGTYASTVGSWKANTMNQTGGTVNMTQAGNNIGHWLGRDGGQDQTYTISEGILNVQGGNATAAGYFLGLGRNTQNFKAILVVKDSGVVNIGNVTDRSGQLNLGSNDGNGNSLLDVQGGTLSIGTGKPTNRLLFFAAGANAGKTATMTQSGGVVTSNGIQFGANTGAGNVDGGGSTGANAYDATSLATLQLSGGSLYVGQMGITQGTAAGALPVSIKLLGGTLGASASWATASPLNMNLGTATIQTANSVGEPQNIALSGILSDESGAGTLTKTGNGVLSLSGVNTYTGATSVNAGTLLVNAPGSLDTSSAVTVASGAALGGNGTINGTVSLAANAALAPGGLGTIGTLTLANSTASSLGLNDNVLFFDLPNTPTASDLVDISGGSGVLNLDGANKIALSAPNGPVPAGTYTLMTYSATTGAGTLTFQNGTTSLGNATLTVGPTSVTLDVGVGGLTGLDLVWKGDVSGEWDNSALNWTRDGTASQAYVDGDAVVFDDSGSNAATISSAAPVAPSAVYFNNFLKNYTVSAVIDGTATLNKLGPATTTLTGVNTYTGDTTISSGTLQLTGLGRLGNGNYAGAMSIAPGAAFETANGGTQILSGAITGGGTLRHSGGGLILSNAGNSYGALNINNANCRVFVGSNVDALPAAATVDIASGTLVFDVPATRANAITVSSGGNLSARQATTLSNVTLPGSGSVVFNNDDANTNLLTITNGQNLTGDLTVEIGGLRMGVGTTVLGGVNLAGNLTGTGGLVVVGSGDFDENPTLFGTGVLTLSGINDYTGDTTVNSGVLAVTGTSIPDSGNLIINDPGKLDLTGNENVSTLFFDAVQQPDGVYSATSVPGGATITTASFSGSGTLTVGAATTNNYASWANDPTKGNIPGEPASGDFDNDGITNIVEYALGMNPRVSSQPAGVLLGNDITYTKGADAIANGDVSWTIETSQSLVNGSWTPQVTQPAADPALTISYTLTPGSPAKNFARLKVVQIP